MAAVYPPFVVRYSSMQPFGGERVLKTSSQRSEVHFDLLARP